MGVIRNLGPDGKRKSGVGSSPAFRRAGRQRPDFPPPPPPADTSDIADMEPEAAVRALGTEAICKLAEIMRSPGRHATAQLGAIREVLAYGVAKPAAKVAAEVDHRIEVVIHDSERE